VPVVLSVLTAVIGLVIAWALTVPLHRYKELRPMTPRDVGAEVGTESSPAPMISASYRQARCPECHHVCSWRDVAPVISWFRGCPECSTRLPATVPILQVGLPVAMVLTAVLLGGSWVTLPYLFLVVVLAAIAVVDLRIWLIPYWMPWAGAAVGLVLISVVSIAIGEPRSIAVAVAGAVATFLVFFLLFVAAPGKLGFGDVRLALLLGLFLAWLNPMLPIYGLLFGAVLGVVMGVVALAVSGEGRFPFGPALCLGTLLAIWLHQPILGSLS
jgi:prepilin signal peptidase PulO-like enzyme (type II secretory pathway)